MILTKDTPVTVIDIWWPKYHSATRKEWEFWPACYRVEYASTPLIKVVFSKAKHMTGLAFVMRKSDIMSYPKRSNGSINCYAVPRSAWEPVEQPEKPEDTIKKLNFLTDKQVKKQYANVHQVFFNKQTKLL